MILSHCRSKRNLGTPCFKVFGVHGLTAGQEELVPLACFQVATPPWDDVDRMLDRVNAM